MAAEQDWTTVEIAAGYLRAENGRTEVRLDAVNLLVTIEGLDGVPAEIPMEDLFAATDLLRPIVRERYGWKG